MSRHLVLIGLMGSGKTTVGEMLADRLHRRFLDSDRWIEERTGRTVKQILAEDGVEGLRHHEGAALLDALARPEPAVIAAAGGTVLSETLRHAMIDADADVIWLSGSPALLAGRVPAGVHRPWIETDPAGTLQRMYDEREGFYREVADRIVEIDARSPEQIVDWILT